MVKRLPVGGATPRRAARRGSLSPRMGARRQATRDSEGLQTYRERIDSLRETLDSMGTPRRKHGRPSRGRFLEPLRIGSAADKASGRRLHQSVSRIDDGRQRAHDTPSTTVATPGLRSRDVTLRSIVWSQGEGEDPGESNINTPNSQHNTSELMTPIDLHASNRTARRAKYRKKTGRGFLRNFAKLGKFVCILIGLWRKHAIRVREFLDNVDMVSVEEISDLLFDKTDYSADKRARISSDTKRILSMPHHLRTDNDIRYVEIALRNYPSIAAYPVSIQNLIARKAWYELYAGRRIIIKQGHVARCFYFILSGKVVISKQDEDSGTSRTLCYLNKGDSFGEMALLNKTFRTATVISEGTVELLVVTDEDYEEIFTSGGLTEKYFPFLKGLSCFQDWPIELLINNINKASIAYSKRKTVICDDTSTTPWLYIIKSGSVTVLKKLKQPRDRPEDQEDREKTQQLQNLSAEDHYQHLCDVIDRGSKMSRREALIRYHKLKELGLGSNVTMAGMVTSANNKHRMDAIDEVSAVNAQPKLRPVVSSVEMADRRKQMTTWQMGPMVTRTGLTPLAPSEDGAISTADSDQASNSDTPQFTGSRRVSFDVPQIGESEKMEDPDCFVAVQTLVKGDVFGLADLIHGKQPTFILVSNGAECIMIDKRLYWDKATDCQKLMRRLKDEVLSYPTDEKMQSDLKVAVNWEKYKKLALTRALRKARLMKKLRQLPAIGVSVN